MSKPSKQCMKHFLKITNAVPLVICKPGKTNCLIDQMPFCDQNGQQLQDRLSASISQLKKTVSDINTAPNRTS